MQTNDDNNGWSSREHSSRHFANTKSVDSATVPAQENLGTPEDDYHFTTPRDLPHDRGAKQQWRGTAVHKRCERMAGFGPG